MSRTYWKSKFKQTQPQTEQFCCPIMDEIEKFLKEINCENILKEHEFDEESILLIEEKDLIELFPKIGPRIKFKTFLKKLKKDLPVTYVDDYTVQVLPSSEPSASPGQSPIPSESELTQSVSSPASSELSSSLKETNAASLDGRAIIREGHITAGLLKEGSRRKLSQLVILNKLEQNPSKTITTQDFYRLATDICEIFPKESVVVYYSAYESSAKGTAKKNASGKLYESYISRRRKLREDGYLPGTRRLSSKSSGSSTNSPVTEVAEEESLRDESLQWLHHNVDPWQEVEEKWRETTELRLKQINKGEGQIDDYFKEFPALQNPAGYTLLLQDFRHMYPEAENKFFSKISLKKDDIIKYAKCKLANTRDKYVKNAIKDLLLLVHDANPETSTNVAISLLAFVINTSPARKKKNNSTIWKPSRAEIYEGFIAQTATEGDFTNYLISKRERMTKLGRTLQPLVAYVGKSVVHINKAYVVINSTVYSFQKLVTAIDCVFKIYQATGAFYPEESEDIWTSIQIGFYEIKTKYDRKTQAVNTLLTDLELM